MADLTTSKQRAVKRSPGPGKPFEKGKSGNPAGRPVGARNKLAEGFLEAMRADFAKSGVDAIKAMRLADPGGYVRAIVSLVPKELDLAGDAGPVRIVVYTGIER